MRMLARDGKPRPVEFTATNLLADETVTGIVVNMRDLSERKTASQHSLDQSARDPLTGLASRAFFESRLQAVAGRMGVTPDKAAVVVVDLDRFNLVNTTAGPASGDTLLTAVAERLGACVRPDDLVARLGDDEFAVLVARVLGADDVVAVAARGRGRRPRAVRAERTGLLPHVQRRDLPLPVRPRRRRRVASGPAGGAGDQAPRR